jgi:pectin-derived oligosaccharide transport system substrate-binding protein
VRSTNRRRYLGLVCVTACVALAACGGTDEVSPPTGEVNGAITYAFWGNPGRAEKVQRVIGLFQAEHPAATVTADVADYNSYVERLTVRAAGGGLACALATQSTFVTPYAQQDVLRPLDDLIERGEIDVSGLPPDVLATGRIDGHQYLFPTGTFVRLLAYNRDLVASTGASEPTDDMTWEQYADWLRAIQRGLPGGTYASEIEGTNMFSLTSWVIGHGAPMFDGNRLGFDRALLARWFEFWLALSADGVTVPPAMISEQSAALELTPMALGKAAVGTRDIPHMSVVEKALGANGLGTAVSSVSMPSEDPARPANVLGTNGMSIPADCDAVSTAAGFIDFFGRDVEAAQAFGSDNGIVADGPAQEALLQDPATPDGTKRSISIFRRLTEAGDLATTTYPAGLSTLTSELRRIYTELAFGQATVDEAVDDFFKAADRALH